MPSILLSDNGVSSGSAGLKSVAASDGSLALQTTTAGGTATTAVSIDTSQNVGIGVSSPVTKLDVSGPVAINGSLPSDLTSRLALEFSGSTASFSSYGATAGTGLMRFITGGGGGTGGSVRMTLDASGNLGLGTTSPKLNGNSGTFLSVVNPSASGWLELGTGSQTDGFGGSITFNNTNIAGGDKRIAQISGIRAGADNSGVLTFVTNNAGTLAERARITNSGQVFVNTTSSLNGTLENFQLYPVTSGSSQYGMMIGGNAQGYTVYAMRFLNTYTPAVVGSITIGTTSTAYNTSSDYRLKNSIAPMTGALAKVAALKPVTYKWNADDSDGEGFIAHELAEVVPQAVVGEKDAVDEDGNPIYQGIDTSFLVATLTAAIQELKAELDTAKAEIAALKGTQP